MYDRALFTYIKLCAYMHTHWKPLHCYFYGLPTGLVPSAANFKGVQKFMLISRWRASGKYVCWLVLVRSSMKHANEWSKENPLLCSCKRIEHGCNAQDQCEYMLGCLRFRQHTHIVRVMIRAERTAASVFSEDRDVKYVVSNCCST